MKPVTQLLDDPVRLRALQQTGLMDAGPQESLDRLTRLASRLLAVPIALVSLVDGERQYFASEVGMAGLRETPLSHSFCQHVVVTESSLVIPDARLDPELRENLAVAELGVIAYAGVPLLTSAGDALGSFCVIENSPRDWSEDDLELLRDLARSVISEIELRMTNRSLRASEAQLSAIFEHIPAGIILRALDGRYERVNSYVASAMGRTAEEIVGLAATDIYPPEVARALVSDDQLVTAGEPTTVDVELTHADGSEHVYRVLKYPIREADGTVTGLGSFALDVTERQRVEDDLRVREGQLADAQALARFGSWELDPAGRLRSSDELCRIFGRPPRFSPTVEEFIELVHPDDSETVREDVQRAGRGGVGASEYRIVRPDGAIRHVHTRWFGHADDQGRITRLWGTTQDVTDRAAAEREIRQAREHAEAIIAAMGEGYALTVDGAIIAVNDALCAMTGFSHDQLVGARVPFPFWPADRVSESQEIRDRVVTDGGGTFEIELMRADGSRFDAEITARAASTPDGSSLGFVNTIRDVSERNLNEAQLERERRDLNDAQAIAEVGSWEYDLDLESPGRWSAQLCRMLGVDPSELAPTRAGFLAMVVPGDRDRVRHELIRPRNVNEPWSGEFGMVSTDNRELVVSCRLHPSVDQHGRQTGVYGTLQDITDGARRDAEERALRRIAELVAENAGAEAVFTAVASEVQRLFGAHSGFVTRFDEAAGTGAVLSGQRADGEPMDQLTFTRDTDTASGAVLRTGRPARVDTHRSADRDMTHDWLERNEISSGVAAPLVVGGHLWGSLSIGFTGSAIPSDAELRLARFARLVSMAIANADAWDTLSRQATTDAVTGLANRRIFQEQLNAEVARARRYGGQLSLVLLDLDHFKAVNDTYGHQAGDAVLTEFGSRLSRQARAGELVARIGGEEFAWLMPQTGHDGAFHASERLRRLIESEPFPTVGKVTVSAGVCASAPELDGEDLVQLADRALYAAKDSGRNTICIHTEDADGVALSR
jgi:diguanylate cyclase (GGDEF)-like protein/PAS domain S-box-containing protein